MTFSVVSFCCSSPDKDAYFSRCEKGALVVDTLMLGGFTLLGALMLYGVGPLHSHLVSYSLLGAGGLIVMVDGIKCAYRLRKASSNLSISPEVVLYHENPLSTVSRLMSVKQALGRFAGRKDVREQGVKLDREFYYQRARGGGNCFYLSYLSGLLHHHISTDTPFRLPSHFNCKEKAAFQEVLSELREEPTMEKLYSILEDEEQVAPLISYLRKFAIYYVQNLKEKRLVDDEGKKSFKVCSIEYIPEEGDKWRYLWNDDSVSLILLDNEDLRQKLNEQTRKDYCEYQGQDGVDVQRPEIGMLHDHFFPLRFLQRADVGGDSATGSYSLDSPIVLFRCPNHFDALIPKNPTTAARS